MAQSGKEGFFDEKHRDYVKYVLPEVFKGRTLSEVSKEYYQTDRSKEIAAQFMQRLDRQRQDLLKTYREREQSEEELKKRLKELWKRLDEHFEKEKAKYSYGPNE